MAACVWSGDRGESAIILSSRAGCLAWDFRVFERSRVFTV